MIEHPPLPRFPMARDEPLDPPPTMMQLLSTQPISMITLQNGQRAWLVTKYEDAKDLLTSKAFSADVRTPGYPRVSESLATWTEGLLVHMDSPEHDEYRRMLAPEFMVKRISRLEPEIQAIVDGLVDDILAKGPPADLVADFAFPIPARMTCALLGVPYADKDFFVECAQKFRSDSATAAETAAASKRLYDYMATLIDAKQVAPTDDVLGYMASNYLASGQISKHTLVTIAQLLLSAGFDTTANMIALGTLTLLLHPEQKELLTDKPELVPDAIEELLRYLTITHWGRHRVATEDVVIGGQLIRTGEGVVVAQDTANRDPEEFPDPNVFDIQHGYRRHLAFGHGVHQCIGAAFARIEMKAAYTTILARLPTLELAVPLADLEFKNDNAVYGLVRMPIKW